MSKFIQFGARLCLLFSLMIFAVLAVLPVNFELPISGILKDDKLQHFLSFFALTIIAAVALTRTPLLALIASLVLFGFAVEYVQPLFERKGDTKDALANLGGIGAAWIAIGAAALRTSLRKEPLNKS